MEGFEGMGVYFVDLMTEPQHWFLKRRKMNLTIDEGDYEGRFFLNFVPTSMDWN